MTKKSSRQAPSFNPYDTSLERWNELTVPYPALSDRSFQHVLVGCSRVSAQVVGVALHRPTQHNALNARAWQELGQIFSALGRQGDDTRVVLLVGIGPSFCSGLDIKDTSFFEPFLDEEPPPPQIDVARRGLAAFLPKLKAMQACFTALEECPLPVLAAVHGTCFGAAVDLICCAQVRWCRSETVFAIREVALGLAADVGVLQRLPQLMGHASAVYQYALTGQPFTAEEAYRWGLVSRLVPATSSKANGKEDRSVDANEKHQPHDLWGQALQWCLMVAGHSPLAVQGTKKALLYARDHTVLDGLDQIATYNALALQSPDVEKILTSRVLGQTPTFDPLPAASKL